MFGSAEENDYLCTIFRRNFMKRRFNIFWAFYSVVIFYPMALVYTIFTATVTIVMALLRVNAEKVGKFDALWARVICYLALSPVRVSGRELVDMKKPYIFLPNHQGAFDVFVIYGWIGNPFAWIMKQELRKIPLVGAACAAVGHIFLDRSSRQKSVKTLLEAEKTLKENNRSVVLFPEGTRTKTGEIGKFKRGAFAMARDMHLPIVPVTIKGSFEVLPKRGFWIKPTRMEMIFHEPIETSGLTDENMNQYVEQTRSIIAADLA